jgi:hypothetical protein
MTNYFYSPEGEAIRDVAEDLADRFPNLPGAVIGRLNYLARLEAARAALEAIDTRGRWVRRHRGNGGPGRAGLGHVAAVDTQAHHNNAVALCGTSLRGNLDWAHRATPSKKMPVGWAPCLPCLREANGGLLLPSAGEQVPA